MERRKRVATYAMMFGLLAAGALLAFGETRYWIASRHLSRLQRDCMNQEVTANYRVVKPKLGRAVPPEDLPDELRSTKGAKPKLNRGETLGPPIRPNDLKPGETEAPIVDIKPNDVDPLAGATTLKDEDFAMDGVSCDPKELDAKYSSQVLFGMQKVIEEEFAARRDAWDNVSIIAFWIAVLFSAPRIWFFLLARIAEVSAAIRGRNDT